MAATYTVNQTAWKQAATNLRQPYWDWAVNSVPPPEVISKTTVDITGPAGTTITVDNPLYRYQFNPVPPELTKAGWGYAATVRYPPGGPSNIQRMIRYASFLPAAGDLSNNMYFS